MTDRGIDPGKVSFAGKDRFRNAFAGKWTARSAGNGPYQIYQVVCPNQHCRSISQAFLMYHTVLLQERGLLLVVGSL